jgi:hypothetical protein
MVFLGGSMIKRKTYTIQAKVGAFVGIEITASNFQDAVAQTKELNTGDFVNIPGEEIDSSVEITAVFES